MGMNPDIFSSDEQKILRACLGAIKYLPIYRRDDFHEVFGLTKSELNEVEEKFPDWDFYDEGPRETDDSRIALGNAFAWIFDGTEKEKKILMKHISYDQSSIVHVYEKFRRL